MSMYLKALGIHVYLVITKYSYFVNDKHLEANAKSIHILKLAVNDKYLSRVSNIESAFVVWNTLLTLSEQKQNKKESDSDEGSDAFNTCYMIQG